MFCWPIAANAPSAMEAIEIAMTICCHCAAASGKAPRITRMTMAIADIFAAAAK